MSDITIRSEASLDFFIKGLLSNGIDVERKLIPVDMVIWTENRPIAIERKSTSDYLRSIKDGSIWEQLKAMHEFTSPDNCYFLIEDYDWPFTLKHSAMNRHAIVSVGHTITNNAKIVPTLSRTHSFEWVQDRLEEVLRKYKETKSYTLRSSAKKDLSPAEQAQYIIEGFPGVGGVASRKIRSNSDSLWNLLEMCNYKTETVTFIPRRLVENIKNVCMTNWRT